MPLKRILQVMIAGALLTGAGCTSKDSETTDSSDLGPTKHLSPDEEIDLIAKTREEQQLNDSENIFSISGKGCRYASAISTRPPSGTVVLTFDDGPHKTLTPQVLNVLRKHGIKATFFMTGNHAGPAPEIVKRAKEEGHIVSSHSFSHPNFHELSGSQQRNQVTSTEPTLRGYMEPRRFFRYPYGNSSCDTNSFLRSRNYKIVGWHIDSCDWGYEKTGTVIEKHAKICGVSSRNRSNFAAHVLETVNKKGGGIVLFHDIRARAMSQLDHIITELLRSGYRFTNLDDPRYQDSVW